MIDPKRIEAAARAILAAHDWTTNDKEPGEPVGWGTLPEDWRETMRSQARAAIAAAFPELSSDPPTAWVAPWEATEAMQADMRDEIQGWLPRGGVAKPPTYQWHIGREVYRAARDAHTKEQT